MPLGKLMESEINLSGVGIGMKWEKRLGLSMYFA